MSLAPVVGALVRRDVSSLQKEEGGRGSRGIEEKGGTGWPFIFLCRLVDEIFSSGEEEEGEGGRKAEVVGVEKKMERECEKALRDLLELLSGGAAAAAVAAVEIDVFSSWHSSLVSALERGGGREGGRVGLYGVLTQWLLSSSYSSPPSSPLKSEEQKEALMLTWVRRTWLAVKEAQAKEEGEEDEEEEEKEREAKIWTQGLESLLAGKSLMAGDVLGGCWGRAGGREASLQEVIVGLAGVVGVSPSVRAVRTLFRLVRLCPASLAGVKKAAVMRREEDEEEESEGEGGEDASFLASVLNRLVFLDGSSSSTTSSFSPSSPPPSHLLETVLGSYNKCTTTPTTPPTTTNSTITSSSSSSSSTDTNALKHLIFQLLLWLVARVGTPLHGRVLLPFLLPSYQASLSPSDLLILRFLSVLSDRGICLGFSVFTPGVGGRERERGRDERGHLGRGGGGEEEEGRGGGGGRREGPTAPAAEAAAAATWLVEWLEPERVFASMEGFPLDRPLVPPKMGWEVEEEEEEEEVEEERVGERYEEGEEEGEGEVASPEPYDPSFLLPLLERLLHHDALSIRSLIDSCLISYTLISLASSQPSTRLAAYACLQRILLLLSLPSSHTDPAAKERPQQLLLLDVLRHSLPPSLLSPFLPPLLPYTHALFLARSALILSRPANDLYVALNGFLVRRPSLDLNDLPLFLPLFYSSRPFHHREKVWALRLLRDGLKTSTDLHLLLKRHCFSLLLTYLEAALLPALPPPSSLPSSSSPVVADHLVVSLCLDVLTAAAAFPAGAVHLLLELGLVGWVEGVVMGLLNANIGGEKREGGRKGGRKGTRAGAERRMWRVATTLLDLCGSCFGRVMEEEGVSLTGATHRALLDQGKIFLPALMVVGRVVMKEEEGEEEGEEGGREGGMGAGLAVVRLVGVLQGVVGGGGGEEEG